MTIEYLMTAMTCLTTSCPNTNPAAGINILRNSAPPLEQLNILSEACIKELAKLQQQIQNVHDSQQSHEHQLEQIEMRLMNLTQQLHGNILIAPKQRTKRSADAVLQLPQSCGMQHDGRQWLQLSPHSPPIEVLCKSTRYGKGWLLAAQLNTYTLEEESTDWVDGQRHPEAGFGRIDELNANYFIGAAQLHKVSNANLQELLLVLQDASGVESYAHFNAFALAAADEQYKLRMLGHFEGDLEVEALQASLGTPFAISSLWAIRPAGRLNMFLRSREQD